MDRVCKTYTEALSASKPLVTVYGGLYGLYALGHKVVEYVLQRVLR